MSKLREYLIDYSGDGPLDIVVDSTGSTAILLFISGTPSATITAITDNQGGGNNNVAWQKATNTGATLAGAAVVAVCCGTNFTKRGTTHTITLTFSEAVDIAGHVVIFDGSEYTFNPANSKGNVEAGATATTAGNAGDADLSPISDGSLIFGGIGTSISGSTSAYACSNGILTTGSATTTGAPGSMSAYVEQGTAAPINLAFTWTTAARFAGCEVWLEPVASDSVDPTLPGPLVASLITTTTYTLTWPAASDNVAVTGYEHSLNGGGAWTDVGNVLTVDITGRTPGSTDNCQVRAYDAAGNRSSAITADVTLGSTSLTTAVISNGSGAPMAGISFRYTFLPAGRIGSLTGITPAEGTVSSNGSGVVTIIDLPAGAGMLLLAFRATSGLSDATTDKVYYQAVTVA